MQENQSKFRSVYPYETEMPRGHRFDSRISPTDFDSTLEWQGSRDLKCVTMTGTAVSRSLAKACNVGKMQIWPSCCSEALNLSIRLNSPAKPFLQACLVRLALLCPASKHVHTTSTCAWVLCKLHPSSRLLNLSKMSEHPLSQRTQHENTNMAFLFSALHV